MPLPHWVVSESICRLSGFIFSSFVRFIHPRVLQLCQFIHLSFDWSETRYQTSIGFSVIMKFLAKSEQIVARWLRRTTLDILLAIYRLAFETFRLSKTFSSGTWSVGLLHYFVYYLSTRELRVLLNTRRVKENEVCNIP